MAIQESFGLGERLYRRTDAEQIPIPVFPKFVPFLAKKQQSGIVYV